MSRCVKIPAGIGKAAQMNNYLRRLNLNYVPQELRPQYIHFASCEEVESCDISRLLNDYGPNADSSEIQKVQGKLLLAVEGYDEPPGELFEIEAIRRYFKFATEVWPHWLYTGSTFTPNLMAVAFAVLPNITVVRQEGFVKVGYNESDMKEFFSKALPAAAWLHNRAGTSKHDGMAQMRGVAAYLGIEF